MSMSDEYAQSPDAAASWVGERGVLYHRVSRTAIVLNLTGGWIWRRLTEPRTSADLAHDLRERFPSLSDEDARRDVDTFLSELTQHAMVRTRRAARGGQST